MLKRFLLVGILFCLPALLFAAEPVLVDTRLLLLAHPLFSQFDAETGRFRNTPSEYVDGGQVGVDALVVEIQQFDEWILRSPQILRERLKDVPLPDRMAVERNFLSEKREKEKSLAAMKMRAYMARMVPGRPGVTPDSSIYPQINQIMADVRAVIKSVKERHSAEIVIDACDFLPVADTSGIRPELLVQNLHFNLWKGKSADDRILEWFAAADNYWAGQMGMDAQIFPVGVTDVRLEAIKLLEERTKGQQK